MAQVEGGASMIAAPNEAFAQPVVSAAPPQRPHFHLFDATGLQVDAKGSSFEAPYCIPEIDGQDCDKQAHKLPGSVLLGVFIGWIQVRSWSR